MEIRVLETHRLEGQELGIDLGQERTCNCHRVRPQAGLNIVAGSLDFGHCIDNSVGLGQLRSSLLQLTDSFDCSRRLVVILIHQVVWVTVTGSPSY